MENKKIGRLKQPSQRYNDGRAKDNTLDAKGIPRKNGWPLVNGS
jgi:hypothetical protein